MKKGGFMQMNMVGIYNGFQNQINRSSSIDMRVRNSSLPNQFRADIAKTNAGNVFGAQCKVTISREGRKLSEQMKPQERKSFAAAGMERLLIRQQEQAKMNEKEHSDTLSEISGLMSEIRSSYAAGEDKETIANKQDALNRLFELKARQEEENERRVKDAEGSAAGASKEQEEIDRKNADLYLMLKSLEEQEEEENAEGSDAQSEPTDHDGGGGSVGERFEESASMLGASAARRELEAAGMIDDMYDSGYGRLAQADAMMRDAQTELDLAAEALNKGHLSEAERNQLASEHMERARNMMTSNYGEMMDLRRKGHQEIQDAKELELRHIEVNPLDGVDNAKQMIMDSGAAAALNEVSQSTLDKASEELERRVQEEIDKRNDVVSDADPDEEDVQEKAEEIEQEKEAEKLEEQELELEK